MKPICSLPGSLGKRGLSDAYYKGIFSDTLLDSLSVDKREQSWRETLALPEPNSVTLVACNVDGGIVGFISGGAERTGRLGYEGELYAIYLLQLAQR
jgi:hypothetical protein